LQITLNGIKINLTQTNFAYLKSQNNLEWWQSIIEFIEILISNEPQIELQTSGSTGEPKKVVVDKHKLFISAQKTVDYFELNEKTTALLCMSAKYIAGQMMIVRAIVSGMNLICIEPSANPLKELNQQVDFTAMIPMQAKSSIDDLNTVKKLIIGGGKVDNSLVELLKQKNIEAYETFGMTETLSHIALRKVSPISIEYFTPLRDISISQGTNSELIIDYPELEIFKMATNDIIELSNNGAFKWIGRKDFIINSGGVKVSPEYVENAISHLLTQPFCITGIPDAKLGEKVVLVVEGEKLHDCSILQKISACVEKYYQPKEVFVVNKFPRTPNGKIERHKIVSSIIKDYPNIII